jgi:hypothetical protein
MDFVLGAFAPLFAKYVLLATGRLGGPGRLGGTGRLGATLRFGCG